MIEPTLSLAFSVHANPGVYALLLGSGVSSASRIPTGWGIVLDLIRKLASLSQEDCEPKPEVWYSEKYGEEADYSKLLDKLAKSPSERSQILKAYIEPTTEEIELGGIKVPTKAHRAIAELVEKGYIKVIVTTNFDRLMETALIDRGITPTVISTPDSIKGALPLPHARCTIIKVHGDYLDTRIKNTPAELEKYVPKMNKLLARVFDEYGLIVCGWSGQWDTALREAIKRCPSRRFTTFWTNRKEREKLVEEAKELLEWRQGVFIRIEDADSFFQELQEKVLLLEEFDRPHPLSAKVAVETVKRYIVEDRHRIRLHDLIFQEVENFYQKTTPDKFALNFDDDAQTVLTRVESYESLAETLISIMIAGCYWGGESHQSLWIKSLNRVGDLSNHFSGAELGDFYNLRHYPVLLLFYSASISALIASKYDTLAALLSQPIIQNTYQNIPAMNLCASKAISDGMGKILFKGQEKTTPGSDYINQTLRPFFKNLLPSDEEYNMWFDLWEYLRALIETYDLRYNDPTEFGKGFAIPGSFAWRRQDEIQLDPINISSNQNISSRQEYTIQLWNSELEKVSSFLLDKGFFQGSKDRYLEIKKNYRDYLKS